MKQEQPQADYASFLSDVEVLKAKEGFKANTSSSEARQN